jgi:hypothetical protein
MRNFIYLSLGTVISTLITFISVPLALNYISNINYSVITLWSLYLIFVQLLDFGICQFVSRKCTFHNDYNRKLIVAKKYNSIIIILMFIALFISIVVPKFESEVYNSLDIISWTLFKISVIVNLKIIYNQAVLNILNRQFLYSIMQIILSLFRYILPIFLYIIGFDVLEVVIYYLISSLIILLFTDYSIGFNYSLLSKNKIIFYLNNEIIKNNSMRILYYPAVLATILNLSDRIIASNSLSVKSFITYSSTFTLASSVNIIVQPFYKLLIANLKGNCNYENNKLIYNLTLLQSYYIIFVGTSIYILSEFIFQYFFIGLEPNKTLLLFLLFSFWGAANGWLLATEIGFYKNSYIQIFSILSAILLFFVLISFNELDVFILCSIWIIHALIQMFVIPIFIGKKFNFNIYLKWILSINIYPFLVGLFIYNIAFYFISINSIYIIPMYALIIFFLSILTLKIFAIINNR